MIVHHNEKVMCFDVDDTLVMWPRRPWVDYHSNECVYIDDPYLPGEQVRVKPNYDHIRLMRKAKARGCLVIVWSHGGSKWAEAVIKGLTLSMYVDIIMTKPDDYVDDMNIEMWGMRNLYQKGGPKE